MRKRIGSVGLLLSVVLAAWSSPAALADEGWFNGYAFSALTPGGSDDFQAVGLSGDGNVLVACTGFAVNLSTDSGQNWSIVTPVGLATYVADVALSADGSTILVGGSGQSVFLSTNSGTSWSESTLEGLGHSWIVRVSPNGQTLLACASGGRVHLSIDQGAHWNEIRPAGDSDMYWQDAALANDGSVIMLCDYSNIYRSTNGGADWTTLSNPEDFSDWNCLAMSADGNTVLIGDDDARLYRSINGGTTWEAMPIPAMIADDDWDHMAISAGGMRMAACNSDVLYTSSDGGATWYNRRVGLNLWENGLMDLALSADGTKILLGQEEGEVILGVPSALPTVEPTDAYTQDIITVVVKGLVADPGASAVIARGVCWNTTGTPTLLDSHLEASGTLGAFSVDLLNLTAGTTYYISTYATNSQGTTYGRVATVALPQTDKPFWARVDPAGVAGAWMIGASSGDGKVLIVQDATAAQAYISRDYGNTWELLDLDLYAISNAEIMLFAQPALSYDGSTILMPVIGNLLKQPLVADIGKAAGARLMLSRDSGHTWTEVLADEERFLCDMTVSNDGQTLHAINLMDEEYFTSTDGGANWTMTTAGHDHSSIAASANGTFVVTLGDLDKAEEDGGIYTSADGGLTWNQRWTGEDAYLNVDCSADGMHIYAVGQGSVASHDGGLTWVPIQPAPLGQPGQIMGGDPGFIGIRVACSADGQDVLIGGIGSLYLSHDAGATWEAELYSTDDFSAGVSENAIWAVIDMSADGKQYYAARYDGKLYVGGYPTLQTVTTADAASLTTFSAVVGGTIDVQRFVPISAHGVCWKQNGTPSLTDQHTTDGTGGGSFTTTLTGLLSGNTYHVRTYAISPLGTVYGEEKTFTTSGPYVGPDLVVTIESGDGDGSGGEGQEYQVGDQPQFIIHVTNQGNGGASGVTVTILIPGGTEFVSAEEIIEAAGRSAGQVVVGNGQVTVTWTDLGPGEQVSVRLVLRALATGQVSLTAQAIAAEQVAPATSNLVVDVTDTHYYKIVTTGPLCGALGWTPLLCTLFLLGLMKRRSGR